MYSENILISGTFAKRLTAKYRVNYDLEPGFTPNETIARRTKSLRKKSITIYGFRAPLSSPSRGAHYVGKKKGDTTLSPWMCYRRLGIEWFNTCGLH